MNKGALRELIIAKYGSLKSFDKEFSFENGYAETTICKGDDMTLEDVENFKRTLNLNETQINSIFFVK